MNIKYIILFIGFLLFITFPIINNLANILPDIESSENRKMKSFPMMDTISNESKSKFLEEYLIDHTSVRNRLIKFYNKLNIFVFKSSPVVIKAIVGKNGWYFMAGEELKTYVGTELFTEQELVEFKNEMLRRKKVIEENHAHFLIAIVPNKSNVYSEYMPDHIKRTNQEGYGMQLLDYLKKFDLPVIDLYKPLTEAKVNLDVYYKTDNHWNDYGAFIGSNEILKAFKKYNNNIKLLDQNTYKIKTVIEKPGNIAKMFSLENEITETNYIPISKSGFLSFENKLNKYTPTQGFPYPEEYELTRFSKNNSLPTVLIIRDSFGAKILPYLSEQCKKMVAIYDGWHYGLNEEIIKGEKPDIVLMLIVESNLKNVIKYQKLENK